jgi:hypothetical protein
MAQAVKSLSNNGGDVTIDSCVILAPSLQSNTYAIEFAGNSTYQETINASNFTISNNIIRNGDVGIQYDDNDGSQAYDYISNILIENNKFENQLSRNISFNVDGWEAYVNNIEIIGNDIQLPINNGNNYGIYFTKISSDVGFLNKISENTFCSNGVDSAQLTGVYVQNCNSNDGILISNNFIDIENNDNLIIGINIDYSQVVDVFHNTIKLLGSNSRGIEYYYPGAKSAADFVLRNNIINTGQYAFYSSSYFDENWATVDNNCYFSLSPSTAFYDNATEMDFEAWKINSNQDISSIFINPMLEGYLNPKFNNELIDNLAPKLLEVDYDINDYARRPGLCDFGANEQLFINLGNDILICFGDSLMLSVMPNADSYIWSSGQLDTNSIYANMSDNYSVTVQEIAEGPLGIDTIFVDILSEIIPVISDIKEPKCFGGSTGYLEINTTGGTAPFSYNWQGAFIDTNRIENLSDGIYHVTITDFLNCNTEADFTVNQPEEIMPNFSSDVFCGGCMGEITANATGGYAPYNFIWSSGAVGQTISDLCTGTYDVTIIDDSMCVQTGSYDILESSLAYISGNLGFSLGNVFGGHARIELYKDSLNGASQIEFVDSTNVAANGYFEFSGVNPESFYLRGIVTSGNAIYNDLYTSYYSIIATTTLWETATLLTMSCGDTLEDINFSMFEIATPVTGPGVFTGGINYGSGGAKSAGEPVPGAEVFVEQEPNDEPIANTETDSLGNWDIEDIPVGTGYHLKVDIPGLPQMSSYDNITVSGTKSIISDLNFLVDTNSGGGIFVDTVTVNVSLISQNVEIKTYPNPVSNYLTIETEFANNVNVSYSIIDIKGNVIYNSSNEELSGKYNKTIDMSLYNNGTYILKLKLDNTFYIRKFIKE